MFSEMQCMPLLQYLYHDSELIHQVGESTHIMNKHSTVRIRLMWDKRWHVPVSEFLKECILANTCIKKKYINCSKVLDV